MAKIYKMLPIHWLCRGRYQPRDNFSTTALTELSESIRNQGIIEPIIVRAISNARYEIIAGERRWRAAQLIPLSEVPCLIGEYSDKETATLTLIENIQRQDLNLIEEAKGYQRLCNEFNFQQQEIASMVSKSRSHVANILRLLSLTDSVQELVKTEQLSFGHARALIGLSLSLQKSLSQQAVAEQWSVRTLEKKVSNLKTQAVTTESLSNDRVYLEAKLAEQVGAPVQIISGENESGWLQIKFFNNDTLAGLLERMGLHYD